MYLCACTRLICFVAQCDHSSYTDVSLAEDEGSTTRNTHTSVIWWGKILKNTEIFEIPRKSIFNWKWVVYGLNWIYGLHKTRGCKDVVSCSRKDSTCWRQNLEAFYEPPWTQGLGNEDFGRQSLSRSFVLQSNSELRFFRHFVESSVKSNIFNVSIHTIRMSYNNSFCLPFWQFLCHLLSESCVSFCILAWLQWIVRSTHNTHSRTIKAVTCSTC